MRTTTLLFTLLPLFASLPRQASAQADSTRVGYIPRSNLVKIGGSSGLFKVLSLNYERVLDDQLSVALTGSYMTPIRPEGLLNLDTDELVISGDRELKGWFITPEVKWYLEQSDERPAPRGFYVGAYARFSNMNYTSAISGTATGSDSTTTGSFTSDLEMDLQELGFGLNAGYQMLMCKDRIALDFVFFGPRISFYTLKLEADLQGDGTLVEDLEEAIEDALGRDITPVDIDLETSGSTTSNWSGLGYRLGFKIGYAF